MQISCMVIVSTLLFSGGCYLFNGENDLLVFVSYNLHYFWMLIFDLHLKCIHLSYCINVLFIFYGKKNSKLQQIS